MSRWISSAELRFDKVMGKTISVVGNSYAEAVAKRETVILYTRVGELFGRRASRYDSHKGSRLIFVNWGSRSTRRR